MKYLVISFILFLCTLQTFAQQDYFVYLQTDNNQAFYVRINNNIYSSTASGYLILSKMADSTASVTIGFNKSVFPEQQFSIPVNHKDAGYVLKNFGDKGWGLFNLQTMAVIMNSNPPQEKKSPEITGIRKNDAFSALLSNAVNDSSVLYAANRPLKPQAPPPADLAEEKKPAAVPLKKELPAADSLALAKKTAPRKDSSLAVTAPRQHKDSIGHRAAGHETTGTKTRLPAADSQLLVKNKTKPPAPVKNTPAPRKDSIIMMGQNHRPASTGGQLANSKPQRKDTIIMMKGQPVAGNKPAVVNKDLKPVSKPVVGPKKDSVVLTAKNVAGKTPSPAGEPMPKQVNAVLEQRPKDTAAGEPQQKQAVAVVTNNPITAPPVEKKDSMLPEPPVKRLRPLITKAAELFTDTSYVAVFVDESKDKFDTIRISIPFMEQSTAARQNNTLFKNAASTDSVIAAKKIIDSLNDQNTRIQAKKDTVAADSLALAVKTVPPAISGTARIATDTGRQLPKDSIPAITPQTSPPPVNNPAVTTATITKDSIAAVSAPLPVAKTDSAAPAMADSVKTVKTPAQSLFVNSDCKEVAWDGDIDKLRIKMLVVTTDEDRIAVAKKLYRQKCLLTRQVKALSELFKTDEGKYKWLDAVYPFVTDSGNFSRLGELIKDEYYLNRFKAMLRN